GQLPGPGAGPRGCRPRYGKGYRGHSWRGTWFHVAGLFVVHLAAIIRERQPVSVKSPTHILALLILACTCLAGCSSDDNEFANSGEEYLWREGQRSMNASIWPRAIAIMQQIEAQFPFGQYAAQSQLELIYAYYRNGEPEAARAAADRFIRLYPDHPSLDYAYYTRGMSFYS